MSGDHDHDLRLHDPRVRRLLLTVLALGAVATLVGVVVLWPSQVSGFGDNTPVDFEVQLLKARVSAIAEAPCAGAGQAGLLTCRTISAVVGRGPTAGQTATFQMTDTNVGAQLDIGDRIILNYAPDAPSSQRYQFSDFERDRPLVLLVVVFVVAVLALSGWKGVRALFAVALSLAVLVLFVLPSLLEGNNTLAVAIVAAALMAYLALYLTHGVSDTTTVALLGTMGALLITGLLAWLFVALTELTGFSSEETVFLRAVGADVDIRGLLLAGVVIGSLGVLDDVTVTQVSAVAQLHEANPSLGPADLYRRGLQIGRDHVASAVNTLVLAYAGTSLPLLLLFTQTGRRVRDALTSEIVATEIVRTLVGSVGLVAAVPLTTWLAAVAVSGASRLQRAPVQHPEARAIPQRRAQRGTRLREAKAGDRASASEPGTDGVWGR